jgi:hypothetical protein
MLKTYVKVSSFPSFIFHLIFAQKNFVEADVTCESGS